MISVIVSVIISAHSFSSDNGLFSASVVYGKSAGLRAESFILYDINQQIIYTKTELDVHTFFISNLGTVFALNERSLYFYDQAGDEMLLHEFAHANGFGFSSDNHLFYSSCKEGVFVYSIEGELVYEFNPGRLFASKNNGQTAAIVSNDTLYIYIDGNMRFTECLSTHYVWDVWFSDKQEHILINSPSGIEIYDYKTGNWIRQ